MTQRRGTKSIKRGKKVRNLRVKNMTARQAKGVKGGMGWDAFRVEHKGGKV